MTQLRNFEAGWAVGVALSALCFAVSVAQAQTTPVPPQPPAQPQAQPQPQAAKDSKSKDSKDVAKDNKDAANQAKTDATKDAKNAKDNAKDAGRDARNTTQDNSQNARDAGRDTSRDTRNQRDLNAPGTARDSRNDSREQGADAQRDERNSERRDAQDRDAQNRDSRNTQSRDSQYQSSQNRDDQRRDSRSSSQNTFRASDIRSADIGLWFDRSSRDRLVISDVSGKGAITKFGFREGDQIVSVNGHRVSRDNDFIQYLFADDARSGRVKVIVMRDNAEEVVYVEPSVLVDEYSNVETDPLEQFGVVIDDRYDDRIVVWKVIPRSPAYYAGIRAGDVFTTFRGQPVASRQDFVKVVTNLDAGSVPVQVRRGDRVRDYAVDVPRYDTRAERRTAMRPNLDSDRTNESREGRIEDRKDNRNDNKNTPATPLRPRR